LPVTQAFSDCIQPAILRIGTEDAAAVSKAQILQKADRKTGIEDFLHLLRHGSRFLRRLFWNQNRLPLLTQYAHAEALLGHGLVVMTGIARPASPEAKSRI